LLEFDDGYTEVTTSMNVLRFEHSVSGLDKAVNGVGGVTTRTFDAFNMSAEILPSGEVRRFRHDDWGRLLEERSRTGAVTKFEWAPRGSWRAARTPSVAATRTASTATATSSPALTPTAAR
jgi:YD repeat-containing protein